MKETGKAAHGSKLASAERRWNSPVGRLANLDHHQILRIILAADIPLKGWEVIVPADWFERESLLKNAPSFRDVFVSFGKLLDFINFNSLYDSLRGNPSAIAARLISQAQKLRAAIDALDLPRDISFDVVQEHALARPGLKAELGFRVNEFEMWADMAGKSVPKPLLKLMPALVACFEDCFERRATTNWKPALRSRRDEPAGPFIRFATQLLRELECNYSATTIHTDLYDYRASQKTVD